MSDPTPFIPSKLDDADLTPHEFRVFCRISRRGDCTESVGRMAAAMGMHEDTLRKALSTLCAASMVSKTPRPGTTTLYQERPPSEWDLDSLNDENPCEKEGGASKGYPFEGYPFEGSYNLAEIEISSTPSWWASRIAIDLQGPTSRRLASRIPSDHLARWDHLPGDWTFDFAAAAMTHFQQLDLMATPTKKKIKRKGEDQVVAEWADTFRLLHEQDGYSLQGIKETMEWLFNGGNFWTEEQAIRSVPPLRAKTKSGDAYKFDVMYQQAHSNNEPEADRDAKQNPEAANQRIGGAIESAKSLE